jgi:cell pole-organizing protein PopZ
MGQANQEPSMEDILASIKRIIAEDSEASAVRAPRSRKGPVAVPDAVVAPTIEPEPEPADALVEAERPVESETVAHAEPESYEPSDVLELTSPLVEPYEEPSMAAAEPVLSASPSPRDEAPAKPAAAILSSTAETASRNAFAALSQLQVRSEAGAENTLEGLVADMLRPMLREWLDRELPGIVERLVEAEVKRVSGRG